MLVRSDLLYFSSHEWVRVEGDEAVVGISDYAQDQLGDITFVELPPVGKVLAQGAEMGSLESVKAASEIYSPVNGEVVAINDSLNDAPELVNKDPYGEGWMVRFKLNSPPSGLLSAVDYEKQTS